MENHAVRIFFSDEDGGYVSDIPALQACSAFGDTREEALAQLLISQRAWLAARAEMTASTETRSCQ